MLYNQKILLVLGLLLTGFGIGYNTKQSKEDGLKKTIIKQKEIINVLGKEAIELTEKLQKELDAIRLNPNKVQFKTVEEMEDYIEKLNRDLQVEKMLIDVFENKE